MKLSLWRFPCGSEDLFSWSFVCFIEHFSVISQSWQWHWMKINLVGGTCSNLSWRQRNYILKKSRIVPITSSSPEDDQKMKVYPEDEVVLMRLSVIFPRGWKIANFRTKTLFWLIFIWKIFHNSIYNGSSLTYYLLEVRNRGSWIIIATEKYRIAGIYFKIQFYFNKLPVNNEKKIFFTKIDSSYNSNLTSSFSYLYI